MVSIDNILKTLKNRGERLTIQRRVVIEALAATENHLTIPDIQDYTQAKNLKLDAATIYRILEKLIEFELVCRTDVGASGVVYELMTDDPHHHLVCLSCGSMTRIPDTVFAPVRDQLAQDFDFQPRLDHMAIFGYCHVCRQK